MLRFFDFSPAGTRISIGSKPALRRENIAVLLYIGPTLRSVTNAQRCPSLSRLHSLPRLGINLLPILME